MGQIETLLSGKGFNPERRKNVRYKVLGSLEGVVVHPDGRKTNIVFGDISKGGLSFIASQHDGNYTLGSQLKLKIGMPGREKNLECSFIVRSRGLDRHGHVRYGLEVTEHWQDMQTVSMLEDLIRMLRLAEIKKSA